MLTEPQHPANVVISRDDVDEWLRVYEEEKALELSEIEKDQAMTDLSHQARSLADELDTRLASELNYWADNAAEMLLKLANEIEREK